MTELEGKIRKIAEEIMSIICEIEPKISWLRYEIDAKNYDRKVKSNVGEINDYTLLSLIDALIPLLDMLPPDETKSASQRKFDVYQVLKVKVFIERLF